MKRIVHALSIFVIALLCSAGGCNRSKGYRSEQNYYRPDGEAAAKAASMPMGRTEKFGQPKKKLFVLNFMNDTPFSDDSLGVTAANELLRVAKGMNRAVIPDDLKSNDTSRDFYSGDKVRLSPLIREGKRLGVTLLVIGRVKKIRYRQKGDDVGLFRQKKAIAAAEVEMRMFDITEGKEVMSVVRPGDSTSSQTDVFGSGEEENIKEKRQELVEEAVRAASRVIAADIGRALEKISWEGRIAKITGGRVYVNAGRASGINLGDILKVMTSGEDIYDPLTGAYMGRSSGQPKGTLEVVDFLGTDGAVAAVHSGGGFVEGDSVQLY